MPADALRELQAMVTKTATFNGAWMNLGGRGQNKELVFRLRYKACNTSSGAGAASWAIHHSADGSNSLGVLSSPTEGDLVLSTTAKSGEMFIRVRTRNKYIRLALTAISGTGATVDYACEQVVTDPNIS